MKLSQINPYSKRWFSKRVMIQRSDTDTPPPYTHSRDSYHNSGSIPKEIGALVALTYINLRGTSIEGTLKIKEMKLCITIKPLF